MRHGHLTLIALFASFLFGAPAANAYIQIAFNASYPSPGNSFFNQMDVYAPNSGAASAPATVLLIHGGSYTQGDKSELTPIARRLADLGYVTVNMNYTLAWFAPGFPQAVYDTYAVIKWIRTTGQLNQLPDRIIVVGVSAGGTIGSTAALAIDTANPFNPEPFAHPRGYQVDGLVHIMGRADLVWNVQTYGQIGVIANYLGTYMNDAASTLLYAQASAITYASPCSPPTVLYHATNDAQVPYGNSTRLAAALTAQNVPAILNTSNVGHSMAVSGGDPGTADTIASVVPWLLSNGQPECGRSGQGPPRGACCTATTCTFKLQSTCTDLYLGDGTTCEPDVCPRSACCTSTSCTLVLTGDCAGLELSPGSTCTPDVCPRGACCTSAGAVCTIVLEADCAAGVWMDAGSACDPSPCPSPRACCNTSAGTCALTYQAQCTSLWLDSVATCEPDECPYPGACCLGMGVCSFVTEDACTQAEGVWTASTTLCQPNPCPQPGACCVGNSCALTMAGGCSGLFGGAGSTCANNPCAQALACCTAQSCTITLRDGCGGVPLTGYSCTPTICNQLATPGACCYGVTCTLQPGINCGGTGRKFILASPTCNEPSNAQTPCCTADFSKDDNVSVQDLFEFLAAWFAKAPHSNVVTNGVGAPTVESLFQYLAAWFAGCPPS